MNTYSFEKTSWEQRIKTSFPLTVQQLTNVDTSFTQGKKYINTVLFSNYRYDWSLLFLVSSNKLYPAGWIFVAFSHLNANTSMCKIPSHWISWPFFNIYHSITVQEISIFLKLGRYTAIWLIILEKRSPVQDSARNGSSGK